MASISRIRGSVLNLAAHWPKPSLAQLLSRSAVHRARTPDERKLTLFAAKFLEQSDGLERPEAARLAIQYYRAFAFLQRCPEAQLRILGEAARLEPGSPLRREVVDLECLRFLAPHDPQLRSRHCLQGLRWYELVEPETGPIKVASWLARQLDFVNLDTM